MQLRRAQGMDLRHHIYYLPLAKVWEFLMLYLKVAPFRPSGSFPSKSSCSIGIEHKDPGHMHGKLMREMVVGETTAIVRSTPVCDSSDLLALVCCLPRCV